DLIVTGVQTCALPICRVRVELPLLRGPRPARRPDRGLHDAGSRRPRGHPPENPRPAARLPRLSRLRVPDDPDGPDVPEPRLGPRSEERRVGKEGRAEA